MPLLQEHLLQLLLKMITTVNLVPPEYQYKQAFTCLILSGMEKAAQLVMDAVHKWECQSSIGKHLSHLVRTLKYAYAKLDHTVMKIQPLKSYTFTYFEDLTWHIIAT